MSVKMLDRETGSVMAAEGGAGRLVWRTNLWSILGNGARLMGINWIEAALGAAYFAVMARFLGPALYGHWAYGIAAYALVVGLAGLGFDAITILRIGQNKRDGGEFLGLILALRLVILLLGAAGFAAYALFGEPDPLSRLVLLLLIPALIGRGVALAARTCFVAYERMADYAKFVALFRSAEAACGIACLAAGGGLIGVVVLHALLWVAEASFGLWCVRSRLARYSLRLAWRPATRLLAEAAILGLSTAATAWLATGPIMMLRHSAIGMALLGQFAIMLSLTMILAGSAFAFFNAALPVLSRSTRRAGVEMAYGRITALVIAVAAMAAACIAWRVGTPVVQEVLGTRYAVAGSLLAPFMLICGAILVPTAYSQALLLADRRWPLALANLTGGVCLALAFGPAVARWGLDGAVLATGCGWVVRAALLIGIGEHRAWQSLHVRLVGGAPRAAAEPETGF
jgi:O-antigen/teichoic acid export membrane protein